MLFNAPHFRNMATELKLLNNNPHTQRKPEPYPKASMQFALALLRFLVKHFNLFKRTYIVGTRG